MSRKDDVYGPRPLTAATELLRELRVVRAAKYAVRDVLADLLPVRPRQRRVPFSGAMLPSLWLVRLRAKTSAGRNAQPNWISRDRIRRVGQEKALRHVDPRLDWLPAIGLLIPHGS
jgi:hypothetical protein